MANLEQLVNLGKGLIGVGFIILPTSRFEIFQNKNWGKIVGEKKERKKNRKEKKARLDNIAPLLFIIPSTFIFRSASLCAFSFKAVIFSPL